VANSVTISGIVASLVMEHKTKNGAKFLSFRMKNEERRGKSKEATFIQVNVFSSTQIRLAKVREVKTGDRVWVHGELMSRFTDLVGHDIVEIRAMQIDPIIFKEGNDGG